MTPLSQDRLAEIRAYFGGYQKPREHCTSPKCQPYGHALMAELFRLSDREAELLAEVERLQEAAVLQGSWEHLANAEQSSRVAAEARVAELEALIADHAATCDEWCSCCCTSPMQRHTDTCQWNQAARNHHARVEGGRADG